MWETIILLFLVAFIAGLLGPIFGIGGGTFFVPTVDALGILDLKNVIALSAISSSTLSIRSNARYLRSGITNIKLGIILVGPVIFGAFLGALTMMLAPRNLLRGILGILLLYSAYKIFRRRKTTKILSETSEGKTSVFSDIYFDEGENRQITYTPQNIYRGIPIMFLGGFASGLLGIGGGAIYTPVFLLIFRLPPRVAITLSMFLISYSSTTSAFIFFVSGLINTMLATAVIIGAISGATIGSKIALRIKNETLRKLIGAYFLVMGLRMIITALSSLL